MLKQHEAVTADTITDEQIERVRRAMIGVPRKTSYHRAILQDAGAALEGSRPCRESLATAYNKMAEPERSDSKRSCLLCEAGSKAMPHCGLCDAGFRRVDGIHVGSQRLGMIPDRPCRRVYADQLEDAAVHERRFVAYVDGDILRVKATGEVRRFATATAAVSAARKASPRKWHP